MGLFRRSAVVEAEEPEEHFPECVLVRAMIVNVLARKAFYLIG
jgi:hypothetical protein